MIIGKYSNKVKGTRRRQTPELWISGPDLIDHEKYYAWQKHRAQAMYRNESYSITWEEWQKIWPTDLFLQRGRGSDDLCLMIIDRDLGWHYNNVTVLPRKEQLQRAREHRVRS